jgi:Ca2+/Na+ antiporter
MTLSLGGEQLADLFSCGLIAKSARFSESSKSLPRAATIISGMAAVFGLLFNAVMSSLPDIFGICMSVTIKFG